MTLFIRNFSLTMLFSTVIILSAFAQNQERGNSSSSNFDFSTEFGGSYFVDEAGIQLIMNSVPLDEYIDPEKYVLGPYDMLSIYGKGVVELNYRGLVVNASGDLIMPILGAISVKGLTLSEATEKIKSSFSENLKNSEIQVSIDRPRPVIIHLGGEIPNPGRYIVPAGTRFDALVTGMPVGEDKVVFPLVEGGTSLQSSLSQRQFNNQPTVTGLDFDQIEQRAESNNGTSSTLIKEIRTKYDLRKVSATNDKFGSRLIDISAYFNSGDKTFNPYLSDGDQIIFTRKTKNQQSVSISGAVNNPFEGSYRENDTFEKLFEIAGGFNSVADTTSFLIYRTENGATTKKEYTFGQEVTLQPNDRIIIPYTETDSDLGSVAIEGQVQVPGIYTIQEGQTSIENLVELAGGLKSEALPSAGYVVRKSLDNRGVSSVSNINPSLLIRSSDQYLEGFDYLELESALNPNRMAIDFNDQQLLDNTLLMDGDKIFIPKNDHTVTLLGQVNQPGFYAFNSELKTSDYISNAGGYTIAADEERVFVIKAGSQAWYQPSETTLNSGDIIFVDRNPLRDYRTGQTVELQVEQLKNSRIQLILTGLSALASVITAYVAINR